MARILFTLILIAFSALLFCENLDSQAAFMAYQEGLTAYNAGDFKRAETIFEHILQNYPRVESDIPELKLYLGISAYYAGDYDKAKTYLQLFPDSPLARELLGKIEDLEKTRNELPDWSQYSKKTVVVSPPPATQTKESTNPVPTHRFMIIAVLSPLISIGGFLLISFLFMKRSLIPTRSVKVEREVEASEEPTVVPPEFPSVEVPETADMGEEEEIEEIRVEELLNEELEDVRSLLEGITSEEEENESDTTADTLETAEEAEEFGKLEGTVEKAQESATQSEIDVFSQAVEKLERQLKELEESPREEGEYVPIEELEKKSFHELVEELEGKEELEEEDLQALVKAAIDDVRGSDSEGDDKSGG